MSLMQLFSPSEFADAGERRWNKADTSDAVEIAVNRIVSGVEGLYSDGALSITVNATGPVVRRRQCADTDFDCNFWDGDAILVANGPKTMQSAAEPPLRLLFSQGLRAVGTWVAVSPRISSDPAFVGQSVTAYLLVRLSSDPTHWQTLPPSFGLTGTSLDRGAPITAPFVGARTTGTDRILEASFDASLMGNQQYGKLAIAELTFTP